MPTGKKQKYLETRKNINSSQIKQKKLPPDVRKYIPTRTASNLKCSCDKCKFFYYPRSFHESCHLEKHCPCIHCTKLRERCRKEMEFLTQASSTTSSRLDPVTEELDLAARLIGRLLDINDPGFYDELYDNTDEAYKVFK